MCPKPQTLGKNSALRRRIEDLARMTDLQTAGRRVLNDKLGVPHDGTENIIQIMGQLRLCANNDSA